MRQAKQVRSTMRLEKRQAGKIKNKYNKCLVGEKATQRRRGVRDGGGGGGKEQKAVCFFSREIEVIN